MPIRRPIKKGKIPQQMRKVDEVKTWIGADRGDSGLDGRMRDRSTSRDTIARLPEHNLGPTNGFREDGIVARQLSERLSRRRVKPLERLGSDFRRAAIRLRKEHVEADDRATMLDDLRNHLSHHRARPWPLPQSLQAPLVDVDDRSKLLARHTRIHQLIDVEGFQADGFCKTGIPDPQCQKAHEKQEAEDSPGSEIACLSSQQSDHNGRSNGQQAHSILARNPVGLCRISCWTKTSIDLGGYVTRCIVSSQDEIGGAGQSARDVQLRRKSFPT